MRAAQHQAGRATRQAVQATIHRIDCCGWQRTIAWPAPHTQWVGPTRVQRRRNAHVLKVAEVQTVQTETLVTPSSQPEVLSTRFFYDGVIFDMDGTLTEAHIDFADMRARTGIPMGDLFTVMESWEDSAQTRHAMDVILDIEAEAAQKVSAKAGLMQLLQLLKQHKVPVALVTRNTKASVQAFLDLIGPEWAGLFNPVLTREFAYVKPDKRLLLHVAQSWGADPSRLLMVGDSLEDVEVGNAAGTATCLVAGGGNEKPGAAPSAPPAGAVATFTVSGLDQLADLLEQAATQTQAVNSGADSLALQRWALEQDIVTDATDAASTSGKPATVRPLAGRVRLGWPARLTAGEHVLHEGAPPPGLTFLDWLVANGALRPGACSFPRMGGAARSLATCPPEQRGDSVLHLFCGDGGLTKMLASQGMQVVGVDQDVMAAQRRGLQALPFSSTRPLTRQSLSSCRAQHPYDVVLLCATGAPSSRACPSQHWWSQEALSELKEVLHQEGRLCAEVALPAGASARAGANPAAIINSINSSGMTVVAWQLSKGVAAPGTAAPTHLRLVARPH